MRRFVFDASIVLGWMLDRPVLPRAALARRLITAGDIPVVPALWRYEVSNAIVISERRGRLTSGQLKSVTLDVEEFSDAVELEPELVQAGTLIELARRTNLTVYDASYLELALRRRLPLATLDDKLREAARRVGVAII